MKGYLMLTFRNSLFFKLWYSFLTTHVWVLCILLQTYMPLINLGCNLWGLHSLYACQVIMIYVNLDNHHHQSLFSQLCWSVVFRFRKNYSKNVGNPLRRRVGLGGHMGENTKSRSKDVQPLRGFGSNLIQMDKGKKHHRERLIQNLYFH